MHDKTPQAHPAGDSPLAWRVGHRSA